MHSYPVTEYQVGILLVQASTEYCDRSRNSPLTSVENQSIYNGFDVISQEEYTEQNGAHEMEFGLKSKQVDTHQGALSLSIACHVSESQRLCILAGLAICWIDGLKARNAYSVPLTEHYCSIPTRR